MSFKASLLCIPLILCSCTGAPDPSALRSYLESEPADFDPAFAVDVPGGRLCALIFDGLVRLGDSTDLEGCLAESWNVSPDGTLYTFHLAGALFSDGSRITASDAAYSLERLLRPDVGSPRGWIMSAVQGADEFRSGAADHLEGVEALDDSTLVVRLSRPFAPFLSMLAMPSAAVVSARWAESAGPGDWRSPVGSGPWVPESWREGERIVLARNPHYRRAAELERVIFRILPERMTQVAEFEVGNLDQLTVPKAEMKRWTTDPAWAPFIERQVELAVTYIGLNCSKPPFDDVRVRRALNFGVDTDALVSGLMRGVAVRSTGAVPPGLRGHDPSTRGYRHDVRLARRLLAEAGYPGGFPMEIWYRDGGGAEQVLEAVQAYLGEIGVEVRLQAREWGTLKEAVNQGVPDAYYLDWYADYPDAENFLFPLFYSGNWGGGGNRARFSDDAVDSVLTEAALELDPDVRYDMYRRLDAMIYEEAPWIYLWHPVRVEVRQPWVEGPLVHPLFYGCRYINVEKTRRGRAGS